MTKELSKKTQKLISFFHKYKMFYRYKEYHKIEYLIYDLFIKNKINPHVRDGQYFNMIGLYYKYIIRHDKQAEKYFKKATEYGFPAGYINLGNEYLHTKNYDKAEEYFLKAKEYDYYRSYGSFGIINLKKAFDNKHDLKKLFEYLNIAEQYFIQAYKNDDLIGLIHLYEIYIVMNKIIKNNNSEKTIQMKKFISEKINKTFKIIQKFFPMYIDFSDIKCGDTIIDKV